MILACTISWLAGVLVGASIAWALKSRWVRDALGKKSASVILQGSHWFVTGVGEVRVVDVGPQYDTWDSWTWRDKDGQHEHIKRFSLLVRHVENGVLLGFTRQDFLACASIIDVKEDKQLDLAKAAVREVEDALVRAARHESSTAASDRE